jgi:hypothetical protein
MLTDAACLAAQEQLDVPVGPLATDASLVLDSHAGHWQKLFDSYVARSLYVHSYGASSLSMDVYIERESIGFYVYRILCCTLCMCLLLLCICVSYFSVYVSYVSLTTESVFACLTLATVCMCREPLCICDCY